MAQVPTNIDLNEIDGYFIHKETHVGFKFINKSHSDWAAKHGAKETIFIVGKETRAAIIKKTIAYIIVNKDDSGKPVWEKWPIKMNWRRKN